MTAPFFFFLALPSPLEMHLLQRLPDDLLATLLSEWVDPENDLCTLVQEGLDSLVRESTFARLAAQPGFVIRATKVLPERTVAWMAERDVHVAWWVETESLSYDFCRILFAGTASSYESWRMNGQLHRDNDLPAFSRIGEGFRVRKWYQHGKLHREGDLPAWDEDHQGVNASQEWWRHDQRHCSGDLPAVWCQDGTQEWWQHNQLHRDGDLPAVVRPDGTQEWWQHNQLHRDGDRPAIVCTNGARMWFREGHQYRGVRACGTQEWFHLGKLHRGDDLPAVLGPDGSHSTGTRTDCDTVPARQPSFGGTEPKNGS